MAKKHEESKHVYQLELTERQAKILSYACDQFSRLICGQDWSYQELFEAAWEKRCKEATGKSMDKEWDGGWHDMRAKAEEICKNVKKMFWGLDYNAMYGIHYDDTADILFDMCRVIRHQLWLDNPNRLNYTVDSENPSYSIGPEPLSIISKIKKNGRI